MLSSPQKSKAGWPLVRMRGTRASPSRRPQWYDASDDRPSCRGHTLPLIHNDSTPYPLSTVFGFMLFIRLYPARFATLSPHPPVHVRWSPWSAVCARSLPYIPERGSWVGRGRTRRPGNPLLPRPALNLPTSHPLLSASPPLSLAVQSRLAKSKQPLSQYHQIKTAVKQLQVRDGKRQTGREHQVL